LLRDGACLHINQDHDGWQTYQGDDWIYYPQQYVNVSLTETKLSIATVGGCCAPNRLKPTDSVFRDNGDSFEDTNNKITAIADAPMVQTIAVKGTYMHYMTDDHAMNLTLLPSVQMADKQSILYGLAFDRSVIITYQYLDADNHFLGNHSTGVLRNSLSVPDVTLPPRTRFIVRISLFIDHLFFLLMSCFESDLLCTDLEPTHFVLLISMPAFMPVRFLCRQPSHPLNMCIFIAIGSFIFSQAWNLINSQSSIFDEWLPRAAKIVGDYRSRIANVLGLYTTMVLFSLRVVIDLPSFVITFARDVSLLAFNVLCSVPGIIAYASIAVYFLVRIFTFRSCEKCRFTFLEVRIWKLLMTPRRTRLFTMDRVRWLFGVDKYVRIPFAVKASLTLLIYCLAQLIPVLLIQMIGVGGVVPVHLCAWSPYLTQLQHHPDPMGFAVKSFMLMQIAVYIATLGAGGCVCVGFGFTGTLYFMVEVSLIGTGIAMLIQLDKAREALLHHVGYGIFVMSFFIALVVQMIQKRITNMLFIKSQTRFSLQNRAPLLHYWYFMMFTSMTRALTSYIIRTLKLILRYPLFSLRVDRNAETWSVRRGDGGFVGYCGMLLAEHEYNNPIMLVFIECLLPCLKPSKEKVKLCAAHKLDPEMVLMDPKKYQIASSSSSQARTRWFLAYTLIHNPLVSKVPSVLSKHTDNTHAIQLRRSRKHCNKDNVAK
ncbi:retinol binding protein receptor-domain-containing protein, partial [Fennellomyces sp. T-0311]